LSQQAKFSIKQHMTRDNPEGLWKSRAIALEGKIRAGDTITQHTLQAQTLPSVQPSETPKDLPSVALGAIASDADLQVKDLIGAGGMGQVHLAWQRSLERDVAIKTTKTQSPTAIQSLMQEGRVMGQLEHPNIIPVHALGVDTNGSPALVMKRIDGVTWSTLLEEPTNEAWSKIDVADDPQGFHLNVLLQLCNAVEFAHKRGILHRDIKPSNVMLGPFGEVYLLDWGVATRMTEGRAPSPSLVGTPNYMAPEMISQAEVSAETDVFLLGGVLHSILCGAPPNQGTTIQEAFLSASEPKEYTFPESIPEELANICRRALAFEPPERFRSAGALRSALRSYLRHRGSISISRATRPKLRELSAAVAAQDLVAARGLFAECQFGLKLALRDWSENKEAREGLREALILMARVEISNEQLANAEVILRELSDPPADLVAALGGLRASSAQKQARQRELEQMAQRLDLSVGGKTRTMLVIGLAGVLSALSVLLSVRDLSGSPFTPSMMLSVSMVPFVFAVFGAGVVWKKIPDAPTRRLVFVVIFTLLCVNTNRALVLFQGGDVLGALRVDLFLLGAVLGVAAITSHPRIWWLSLVQFGGYLIAALAPSLTLHIFNVTQPLTMLLFAVLDHTLAKKHRLLV
jgi:serine/threonine protein kinase